MLIQTICRFSMISDLPDLNDFTIWSCLELLCEFTESLKSLSFSVELSPFNLSLLGFCCTEVVSDMKVQPMSRAKALYHHGRKLY